MTLSSKDRQELRQFIVTFFNDQELRTLCFDISVDFDSLSGDSKDAKARELIGHAERRALVSKLLLRLQAERPVAIQKLRSESLMAIINDFPNSGGNFPETLPSKTLSNNPYIYGPLVTDPSMFFGRKAELDTLCTRLRNAQSTSVVGLRRIGKSMLLYRLSQILCDNLGQTYIPLYIDLQDPRYRTVGGFVDETLRALDEKTNRALNLRGVTDLAGFADAIDRVSKVNNTPVLCLDEFEEFIQRREEFDDDFLEALRALAGKGKMVVVTASRAPLTALMEAGKWTSDFYNIFTQIELGLLDLSAAEQLRHVLFERKGSPVSQTDEALIIELAGRHPFYLQMACHHLYEVWSGHPDNRAILVRERFEGESESHFYSLWRRLNNAEKIALKVIVGQAVPTEETESTFKRLARLGVVEETDGDWCIFSQAFARQVQKYPTPTLSNSGPGKPVGEDKGTLPPSGIQFLLFAGVATAAIVIAALISLLLPEQRIRPTLIITALVLLFGLVGAGKLTGYDFLQALGRLIGLGK